MPTTESKPIDPGLIATPFSYGDLVQYQTGAIVSRTIIDKPAGTVTVFAFDKGQRLSEHTVPYDALLQVVDGDGVITVEGTDHTVRNGQQIIMPAHHPHAVRADERFKMVLIMIWTKMERN
jgi:quercetin dioxygenase-like cupin family protein